MQYIMLIVAAALLGVDFAINKIYQRAYGASLRASLCFNLFLGAFSAVIFFILGGCKVEWTWFSLLMATASSFFIMSYNLIGFQILEADGKIAMYTMYLLTGGMVVPYVWGLLFMGEPFRILRTIGLVVIILGIMIPNFSGQKSRQTKKVLLMCAAVFIINGAVSVISKIHQSQATYACVSATGFVTLYGLAKAVLAACALCFTKKEAESGFSSPKKLILITAASAVFSGVSYLLQLIAAESLPATVLYPFVTGGGIIFSALSDILVFKERISAKLMLSIGLCFFGTLFFI